MELQLDGTLQSGLFILAEIPLKFFAFKFNPDIGNLLLRKTDVKIDLAVFLTADAERIDILQFFRSDSEIDRRHFHETVIIFFRHILQLLLDFRRFPDSVHDGIHIGSKTDAGPDFLRQLILYIFIKFN